MRILFASERVEKSSPLFTWKVALERAGVEGEIVDIAGVKTADWIRMVLASDFVVFQGYTRIGNYTLRQLAFAVLLGRPVIRKWSGSDVLFSVDRHDVRMSVLELDRIVSLNLTSEHHGLVSELESIGIEAILTSQVISEVGGQGIDFPEKIPRTVLVYLPAERWEFYRGDIIESVIEDNEDIEFIVVADTDHRLSKYANVTSLGWVNDMKPVWDKVGLLIRITKHDGYARSIVEALSRGRYVIHNNAIGGCWYAESSQEVSKELRSFMNIGTYNLRGIECVKNSTSGIADQQLKESISAKSVTAGSWFSAFKIVSNYYYQLLIGTLKTIKNAVTKSVGNPQNK